MLMLLFLLSQAIVLRVLLVLLRSTAGAVAAAGFQLLVLLIRSVCYFNWQDWPWFSCIV